ncbi:MAG: carbamoyltransferase [Candidatus Omnitrophica bacterium]|nr:carbamoyltransferase [Candidatus Omnitrophota bacterium]
MYILGINAYHGDAAAALIKDGKPIVCVEEERFRRIKHWAGFPREAIKFCLEKADISIEDVKHIGVSRNPLAHLDEKIFFIISGRPNFSKLLRDRLENVAKIRNIKKILAESLGVDGKTIKAKFHSVEHHLAHMASAFLVSPFEEAAILSIDGFGDFRSTMWGVGKKNDIKVLNKVTFPHSLGILYTAITQYLGFPNYGDEYKVMGLAAYGQPRYLDKFKKIVHVNKDGTFELNLDYFVHHKEGAEMTWEDGEPVMGKVYSKKLIEEFGSERTPDAKLTQRYQDIASSLQVFLEEVEYKLLNILYGQTKLKNLCLAGGVAFNSMANGKILSKTPFKEIFIQPAAGDAGTALGTAYNIYNTILKHKRNFVMEHTYWGPGFSEYEIHMVLNAKRIELEKEGCVIEKVEDKNELCRKTAQHIAEGKVVGWFQGRMEWGPRALGNRSILVDPRRKEMKDVLNARVKKREWFRPFAPSILLEKVGEYFEKDYPDPFMLKVYPIKKDKREIIPAVTHIDGTGRLQTVKREENPLYWQLIKQFENITGVPVLLNTSFNENEPIVCRPEEALDCFLRTKMDVLVIGDVIIQK